MILEFVSRYSKYTAYDIDFEILGISAAHYRTIRMYMDSIDNNLNDNMFENKDAIAK